MLSANDFLNIVNPSDKPNLYRLGKIDSSYTSGRPKIVFDGETLASTKQYPYLASYIPVANDRILMLIVAGSYVILGKIV